MIYEIIKEGKRYFNSDYVTFDGEMIKCEDSSISLKELSTILFYSEDQKQLVSSGSYVGTSSAPPYMVGGAEIEIDKRTGHIDLINYVAAVDCGNVINPNLAKIQVEGALVQGLGMTLYEEVNYTELGRNFNNSFLRYNVPTRMEISDMDISFVDSYEPSGPYGAKSVGEIGIDTPPAAIANAIKDALGIRFNRLPIKSEMVWKEIKRM
jgi:CO/xanthine dehydrogenase Mo-binding subunit